MQHQAHLRRLCPAHAVLRIGRPNGAAWRKETTCIESIEDERISRED